MKIAP